MTDALRNTWIVLRTPVLQLADRMLVWWLMRRGYVVMEEWAYVAGREALAGAGEYAIRSGHLNTVSGRRPRSVKRVVGSMQAAYTLTQAVRPSLGRDALPPAQTLPGRARRASR